MKKSIWLVSLLLLTVSALYSQLQTGQWNIHLPYFQGIEVTQSEDYIYSASNMGLFTYHKKDHAVETLSKINGLSDVGISALNYNPYTRQLLVAYTNSNLDLIESNQIENIPDIKNKIMTGDKRINRIYFQNQKAFLACGFGIVILDMQAREFLDTWLIGPDGGKMKIADFTQFEGYYYAATEKGLYRIDTTNSFPANYANWEKLTIVSEGEEVTEVENFKDELFIVLSDENGNQMLRKYSQGAWSIPGFNTETKYSRLVNQDSLLLVVQSHSLEAYDETEFRAYIIYNYSLGSPRMQSALADENGHYWIADYNYGLIRSVLPWSAEQIIPNGPYRESAFDIAVSDNQVWVAGGGRDPSYTSIFSKAGIYQYSNYSWQNFNSQLKESYPDYLFDICTVIVDPMDSKRVFAGSWGCGLLEFYDNQLIKVHNDTNSTIQSALPGLYMRIGGLAFDQSHNLWVSNAGVNHVLSCLTPDNEWIAMPYGDIASADQAGQILIDQNNYKWLVLPRGEGLFILDDNGTPEILTDDQKRKLLVKNEEGEVVNDVFSIAEDHDGVIWVGTNQGILLFYNSWSVFEQLSYYGNRIIVNLDGSPQVLLGTETITDIAIDGANRKWLATQSGGVFLMSSDGRTQLANYNSSNSPLLSNTVYSIAINHLTGEVFFGTDKGISSLKAEATASYAEFGKLLVYPNPVRPDYEGDVVIHGAVENTTAYITDVSGNIVYSSLAYGGQIVWNRKDFAGREVASGIYLVFCAGEEGSKSAVTKLLIIN